VREVGWSEEAVVEAVFTIGLFGLLNRVSLGRGLISEVFL
jgi:alkylhydroperoxidase family enzyme